MNPWLERIARVDDFDIGHLVDPLRVGEICRVGHWNVSFAMSATQRNERVLPVGGSAFGRKTDRQIQISFEENVDFIFGSSFRESRFVEFFRKAWRVALNRRPVFLWRRTFEVINCTMKREKQGGKFGSAKSAFSDRPELGRQSRQILLAKSENRKNRGIDTIGKSGKLGNQQNRGIVIIGESAKSGIQHNRGAGTIGEPAKSGNPQNRGIGKIGNSA